MKAGNYRDRVVQWTKEQTVRKASQTRAAYGGQHQGKLQLIGNDPQGLSVNFSPKERAETDRFFFIPALRFDDFQPCSRHDDQRPRHGARAASSAFSCSQVTPPARSRSKLSMRRSSSTRCAGATGNSASLRLSHKSPISASRSGGLRRAISSKVSVLMTVFVLQVDRRIQPHHAVELTYLKF